MGPLCRNFKRAGVPNWGAGNPLSAAARGKGGSLPYVVAVLVSGNPADSSIRLTRDHKPFINRNKLLETPSGCKTGSGFF